MHNDTRHRGYLWSGGARDWVAFEHSPPSCATLRHSSPALSQGCAAHDPWAGQADGRCRSSLHDRAKHRCKVFMGIRVRADCHPTPPVHERRHAGVARLTPAVAEPHSWLQHLAGPCHGHGDAPSASQGRCQRSCGITTQNGRYCGAGHLALPLCEQLTMARRPCTASDHSSALEAVRTTSTSCWRASGPTMPGHSGATGNRSGTEIAKLRSSPLACSGVRRYQPQRTFIEKASRLFTSGTPAKTGIPQDDPACAASSSWLLIFTARIGSPEWSTLGRLANAATTLTRCATIDS